MRNRVFVLLVLLQGACALKEDIRPVVSFHNHNVLLPSIEFTTRQESEVFIAYWPSGNIERVQHSKTSKGAQHRIVLLNLKPSTPYNYNIYNATTGNKTEDFVFQTGLLPEDITQTKKLLIDTSQFSGFVLVRRLAPKGSDVIIDNEGDVVWYHSYDEVVRRPFFWTNHRSILSIYDSAQIVEYDMYGRNILNISLEDYGIFNMVHHDVLFNDKGNIVSLTHDSVRMDMRKFGYNKDQVVRADGILVVNANGEKVWEWNLLSVYNPLHYPKKDFHLKHSLGHANSIAIDKDGHYVISFRDFSQLWKVNSVDGSVIWKLGENGDFKMNKSDYFIRQHAIHFNKAGELMLFDNGDRSTRPNSRVLSFELNEETMEASVGINVVLPLELSADKMCSAEVIDEEKYLICTSTKNGIISVVNNEAEILWRVDLTSASYRAFYLPDPFGDN